MAKDLSPNRAAAVHIPVATLTPNRAAAAHIPVATLVQPSTPPRRSEAVDKERRTQISAAAKEELKKHFSEHHSAWLDPWQLPRVNGLGHDALQKLYDKHDITREQAKTQFDNWRELKRTVTGEPLHPRL